jgi:hypothetical protein
LWKYNPLQIPKPLADAKGADMHSLAATADTSWLLQARQPAHLWAAAFPGTTHQPSLWRLLHQSSTYSGLFEALPDSLHLSHCPHALLSFCTSSLRLPQQLSGVTAHWHGLRTPLTGVCMLLVLGTMFAFALPYPKKAAWLKHTAAGKVLNNYDWWSAHE